MINNQFINKFHLYLYYWNIMVLDQQCWYIISNSVQYFFRSKFSIFAYFSFAFIIICFNLVKGFFRCVSPNHFFNLIFYLFQSDPILHSSTGERSDVKTLLQKLILEENQFAVQDILPNTVPDPSSLSLSSEYACPIGQVVMVPDCGRFSFARKKWTTSKYVYKIEPENC